MKRSTLTLLIALLTAASLASAQTVILGKGDFKVIHPDTTVSPHFSPNKKAFFERFLATVQGGLKTTAQLSLENPPEWGKTLSPETHGRIEYLDTFEGGFVGRLTLAGLAPHHQYRLTLNGRPDLKGNDLLPDAVPGLPDEKFFDFLDITTDEHGGYQEELGILLTPGAYHVRLYVKDPDDWKIVLYRDYFEFEVK